MLGSHACFLHIRIPPPPASPSFQVRCKMTEAVLGCTGYRHSLSLFYSEGCRDFSMYVSQVALGHRPSEGPLFLSLFWFLCVKN